MSQFIPLENETGKFIFTPYGIVTALVFEGDHKFIERCCNLICNFAPRHGEFHQLYEYLGYYLLSEERIMETLRFYYYCQLSNEPAERRNEIAAEKALKFWNERVEKTTLNLTIEAGAYQPYAVKLPKKTIPQVILHIDECKTSVRPGEQQVESPVLQGDSKTILSEANPGLGGLPRRHGSNPEHSEIRQPASGTNLDEGNGPTAL